MAHARAAEVTVATGSDAGGNAHVIHGSNAVEMVMLVECGYTPLEALRAATSVAATAIGVDGETGTIEKGKSADLAVFRGDPLEDIEIVSTSHDGGPSWVISRGRPVLVDGEARI
jgi:imidazolonepropionase-like amidohydrolase